MRHTGFSIIMPTYNQAAFIRRAIACLQRQTYSEWELIIVNDGSNDDFDPDDKEGRKNLYFAGHKHVYAFEYKLNLIPDSLYYKKLVNIAKG